MFPDKGNKLLDGAIEGKNSCDSFELVNSCVADIRFVCGFFNYENEYFMIKSQPDLIRHECNGVPFLSRTILT